MLLAVDAAIGTPVGSGRVSRAGWRGAFVGNRRYLARLQGQNKSVPVEI
jgi:hypothetical protein